MKFVSLQDHHGAALASFLADFGADENIHGWFCAKDCPFDQQVTEVNAWARGELLLPGWVPCTTFFAEEDGALLGVLNFRHVLNEHLRMFGGHIGYSVRPSARRRGVATWMLGQALPHARAMGLDRVLLTCDPANIGSVKTIEAHGGVMEDEVFNEAQQRLTRRYWITL